MTFRSGFFWGHSFTVDRARAVRNGFTLIELLVVISIIGVLSAALITNFVGVRGRAGDARLKSDLKNMQTALRLYYNDFQNYPASSGTTMMGCGSAGTSACSQGGEFSVGSTVYMKQLPADFNYFSDGADEFVIVGTLQNDGDEDIAASQTRCDLASRAYVPASGVVEATDFVICEN